MGIIFGKQGISEQTNGSKFGLKARKNKLLGMNACALNNTYGL